MALNSTNVFVVRGDFHSFLVIILNYILEIGHRGLEFGNVRDLKNVLDFYVAGGLYIESKLECCVSQYFCYGAG